MSGWRWKYFQPAEVLSPEGLIQYEKGNLLVQPHVLDVLDQFRYSLNAPILVNFGQLRLRGYRSCDENKQCGGRKFSRHLQGMAFDITVPGMEAKPLATAARDFGWTYVQAYPKMGFVHIDYRPVL